MKQVGGLIGQGLAEPFRPPSSETFIFILAHGALSLAELSACLALQRAKWRIMALNDLVAVVQSAEVRASRLMQRLGGCHKVARCDAEMTIRSEVAVKKFGEMLDRIPIAESDHGLRWGVSVYCQPVELGRTIHDLLVQYFAERLRQRGIRKAVLVRSQPSADEASLDVRGWRLVRRRILELGFEIVAACVGNHHFLGRTVAVVDHEGYARRDFERPVQRPYLSMAPRLARILVNLAGVGQGHSLLDPFCGIGTILQEALLLGADVWGVDVDERRVRETRENLAWISKQFVKRHVDFGRNVRRADARELTRLFPFDSIDAIATEPILLPPLRDLPSRFEGQGMLARAEATYGEALRAMARVLRPAGRIAVTVPVVPTHDGGRLSFPLPSLAARAGLSLQSIAQVRTPQPWLTHNRPSQKIGRAVYLLVKSH